MIGTHKSVHELILENQIDLLASVDASAFDGPALARIAISRLAARIEEDSDPVSAEIFRAFLLSMVQGSAIGRILAKLTGSQTLRITRVTLVAASTSWRSLLITAGVPTIHPLTQRVKFLPASGVSAFYNVGAAASANTFPVPGSGIEEPYDLKDVIDARFYEAAGTGYMFVIEEK